MDPSPRESESGPRGIPGRSPGRPRSQGRPGLPQVLFAACELGLFDLLAEAPGPLDVAAISEGLGASPRGTELLLEACVPLRLLDVDTRGGTARYANSELARAYLTSRSPTGQRAMLRYLGSTTYRCWAHLADAVRWAGLSRPPGGAGAGVMTPGGGAGAGGQQGSCPRCAPGCGGPGALQRGKLSLCPDAGHRRAAPEKQWSALQGDRRVRGQDEGTGHLWVLPRMLTMSQGEDTFLLLRQGSNQYLRAFGVPAGDLFAAIYRSPAERLQFTRGLQEIWSVDGRRVLTAFDLSPFRTVCDLGGGAGALAQQCASLYPGCRVTVFEVPEVVQTARAHLPLPTEGQVGFREGSCTTGPTRRAPGCWPASTTPAGPVAASWWWSACWTRTAGARWPRCWARSTCCCRPRAARGPPPSSARCWRPPASGALHCAGRAASTMPSWPPRRCPKPATPGPEDNKETCVPPWSLLVSRGGGGRPPSWPRLFLTQGHVPG
ncbi:acetylserotonin O-methyltransferase isoform X1 [Ictidomys tridecemlineatus]